MTIYPNMNKEDRNRILQSRYSLPRYMVMDNSNRLLLQSVCSSFPESS